MEIYPQNFTKIVKDIKELINFSAKLIFVSEMLHHFKKIGDKVVLVSNFTTVKFFF
jgi:hypothetical protein